MATASSRPIITVAVSFTVDEEEIRALDALAGYGDDGFVKAFYEKLGTAYMRDHEQGLRRFLKTIRGIAGPAIARVDEARKLLQQ